MVCLLGCEFIAWLDKQGHLDLGPQRMASLPNKCQPLALVPYDYIGV